MKNLTLIILGFSLLSIQSCKKDSAPKENDGTISEYEGNEQNESKVSRHNMLESHNSGTDCMSCHTPGSTGEGLFKIAGTVYDSTQVNTLPNTIVKLFTGAGGTGTLKYTIQVDGRGNFYTTNTIDFSTPLYPVVIGTSSTKYMSSSISTGACMSCHNNSTGKIWVK